MQIRPYRPQVSRADPVDRLWFQSVQHARAVLPERQLHAEVPWKTPPRASRPRTSTGRTASSRPCATPASPTPPTRWSAIRRRPAAMGHRMVAATDEQIDRLVGGVADEFDAEDEIGDVQPDGTGRNHRSRRATAKPAKCSPPPTRPWPRSSRRKPTSCSTPCCTPPA